MRVTHAFPSLVASTSEMAKNVRKLITEMKQRKMRAHIHTLRGVGNAAVETNSRQNEIVVPGRG